MDNTIIAPIIHLNGDRPETLCSALERAYIAVGTALLALKETAPNARNYYPQPGLFEQAVAQYQQRIAALKAVRLSLVAEHEATATANETYR